MRRYTSLVTALGGVALLFGIASLLLSAFSPGVALWNLSWIWGNFVVGALLLTVGLVLGFDSLRERMSSGEARRVGTYGTSAILSTVLSLAIVVALGYLAARNPVRFDWTETHIHSLSDQTRKVLDGLERDVNVTALYSRVDQLDVKPLLERYAYASKRFHYTLADPNERPDLVQKLGIEPDQLKNGLLHLAIGDEQTNVDEATEAKITNAIVKLTRKGNKKIYFVTGHGERDITSKDATGFSQAVNALTNENYAVEPLLLATKGSVPDDASAVVVAGPTRPFLPEEESALDRYLLGGGSLLVMVDPNAQTNLYGTLSKWGVDLGADVIVDYLQGLFGRATTPLASEYPAHPINAGLKEPVMFHVARSVRARPEAKAAFTEIIRTSKDSWAERNLNSAQAERGPDDLPGPVPVAVAGTVAPEKGGGKGGRLVVIGDSDFATNQLLDAYRNRDFFVNSVNWLLGDVEAISIRPNTARASRFNPSQEQFTALRYLSLFVLPELIAVLGVCSWWWRRRSPGR